MLGGEVLTFDVLAYYGAYPADVVLTKTVVYSLDLTFTSCVSVDFTVTNGPGGGSTIQYTIGSGPSLPFPLLPSDINYIDPTAQPAGCTLMYIFEGYTNPNSLFIYDDVAKTLTLDSIDLT